MVRVYLMVAVALLAPAAAFAQTYDTPQTLAVALEPPYYTYVDEEGYSVTTGMVRNESETSYVGNTIVMAKFYGDSSPVPLDTVSAKTLLDVIPPGSSSPYMIRSAEPDPRISVAVSTLLLFDPVGPKQLGLEMQRHADGVIRISDTAGAPHSNVTLHVAYHDAFEPPRILGTHTYSLGGMEIGGVLNLTSPDLYPPNTRGVMAFAESDVFSADAVSWRTETAVPKPPPMPAHILDAWVSDHTGERILSAPAGGNLTLNCIVETPQDDYWLYIQVTARESGAVVFLESAPVVDGEVSIPWMPAHAGEYIVEMFLWGEGGAPASRPSPILLFSVE